VFGDPPATKTCPACLSHDLNPAASNCKHCGSAVNVCGQGDQAGRAERGSASRWARGIFETASVSLRKLAYVGIQHHAISSFPRKRESRAMSGALALGARFRGHDERLSHVRLLLQLCTRPSCGAATHHPNPANARHTGQGQPYARQRAVEEEAGFSIVSPVNATR
jgi:hypothetical protein